jgi:hypothetical protein
VHHAICCTTAGRCYAVSCWCEVREAAGPLPCGGQRPAQRGRPCDGVWCRDRSELLPCLACCMQLHTGSVWWAVSQVVHRDTMLYCTCPRRLPAPPSFSPPPPLLLPICSGPQPSALTATAGKRRWVCRPSLTHQEGRGHSRPGQEGTQGRGQLAQSKPADAHSQVGPPG